MSNTQSTPIETLATYGSIDVQRMNTRDGGATYFIVDHARRDEHGFALVLWQGDTYAEALPHVMPVEA